MQVNLDQCTYQVDPTIVYGMDSRDPRNTALELLRDRNSLDTAVRIASDRALQSAARDDDDEADFWADVFWVLIEIEKSN